MLSETTDVTGWTQPCPIIFWLCETSLIPTPVSADWCLYDFFIFLFWWLIWRKSICTRFIAHTILLYSHLHSSRVTSVRRLELFFPPPLPSLPFSMPNLNFSWNLCNAVFTGLKMALNSCKHFYFFLTQKNQTGKAKQWFRIFTVTTQCVYMKA